MRCYATIIDAFVAGLEGGREKMRHYVQLLKDKLEEQYPQEEGVMILCLQYLLDNDGTFSFGGIIQATEQGQAEQEGHETSVSFTH